MLKRKKNNKGFTLVELLVVMAIIGILAMVAVPKLLKNIEKGKIADLEADISAIRSAALSVYSDTSTLPETVQDIIDGEGKNSAIAQEIEGLSNPFKSEYAIDSTTDTKKTNLVIKVGTSISKDGVSKLKNDLGEEKVTADKEGVVKDGTITVELMSIE